MKDLLVYWYRRLDPNGQASKWTPVNAGVFQGSRLGHCKNNLSAEI